MTSYIQGVNDISFDIKHNPQVSFYISGIDRFTIGGRERIDFVCSQA